LFTDPFLLFIAFFVWIGAGQESQSVQIKESFSGIPIRTAMQTHFSTLSTASTLGDAVKLTLDGSQHEFPVMWGETVMGILTRGNLLSGLSQYGPDHSVTSVMEREFQTAQPNEMLESVLKRLSASKNRSMPVMEDGKLVGLLTLDNIGEYLMIQRALHQRQRAAAPVSG
ncbi:MAG: CBS domain-containing protein, partial [Acidobacteriaceae bacterium]|nr:CBS domain-containing protein [Acidobacteriaceae bacterium]